MTTGLYRETTSADLVVRALARDTGRPVLREGDRSWSAGALADEVSRYAQAYDQLGLRAGSSSATLAGNRAEVLMQLCANIVTGVRGSALHPLGSLEDQAYILEDAEIETLFYDPVLYEQRAVDLAARVPSLKRIIALAPSSSSKDLPALAQRFGPRRLVRPDITPADVFQVAYTGGTTGQPKGVVSSVRAQVTLTNILLSEWDWPRGLKFLCCTPISHSGRTSFMPTLVRGGEFIVHQGFDPERFLDEIDRSHITTTVLVPTMIYRLLDEGIEDRYSLESLDRIYYGASAMSPSRLAEAIQRIGSVFFQFYGQAECPMTVTTLRPEEHRTDDLDRLASCGRAMPWLDVTLLDDDLNPVDQGDAGEICVRGPLVMSGYLNQPEQTEQALRGGWLHTGDVARADEDDYLTIVDRKKDIIISGGFNVYPREVEDVLTAHPDVSAAAVIGVPDADWGEIVKAVIVRRPSSMVAADELIQLVKARKGAVYAPKSVDFVDAIPLSPLGKPDKKALRAPHWRSASRQIN
jgi:fatty-acyl-CoA synthase